MRASAVIRFGITGHQNIPADARDGIETRIRAILAPHHGGGLAGIGCLAGGADQLFARCVLDLGGILEVVIPCHGYETTFAGATEHDAYHAALAVAASVERLPYDAPSEEAFMAAGVVVADRCDLLIAVWDGQPAQGLGGTGDVVRYAREIGREVLVVWPDGVRRS
jgi:hypothetical protein